MILHPVDRYPEKEQHVIAKLNELFIEWEESAVREHGREARILFEEKIVVDGFYPHYMSQKKKILFIGRESLKIDGSNYIQTLQTCYRNGLIGSKPINNTSFHALMFYITFAVNNEVYDWHKIPFASTLKDTFATENGISFAFMNLSKLSNATNDWKTEWCKIDDFLNHYGTLNHINFINKQIELINPDMIITMNFGKYINYLGTNKLISKSKEVNSYLFEIGNDTIQLFDMFHFSAPGKSSRDDYFYPLLNMLLKDK